MKGWSGLLGLVLATVITVSGILFGAVEYYRSHPFEQDEIQNFANILFLGSIPFWLFLLFKYIKVRISEREWNIEQQRLGYGGFYGNFQAGSPIENKQFLTGDPLPPPSPNMGNRGGINPVSENQSGVGGSQEDIIYAVKSFISLNGGLNFKDQSSIARIVGTVIREVTKGEVDQTLFRMVQSGILISKEGVLYLNSADNGHNMHQNPAETVINVPVSEVMKVEKEKISVTDAQRIAGITRLLREIHPDKQEFQFQLNMIMESCAKGIGTYQEVLTELLKQKSDNDARKKADELHRKKQAMYEARRKELEMAQNEESESDSSGTVREFAGTAAGQSTKTAQGMQEIDKGDDGELN